MSIVARESEQLCRVLEQDPDLSEAIPAGDRERATQECLARLLVVPAGRWRASQAVLDSAGIGLLVLSGLLIRRVGIDGRFGAELLGSGDLLRPWQREEQPPTLPLRTRWRVIEAARMAMLDRRFARCVGRYPQLGERLVERAVQRSRNLAVNMAIVHHARVDVRLHMLFWHLAGRWGRVHSDGVHLPLRLTHAVLSDLTASRRPTVTSALSELTRSGLVRAEPDGWLLTSSPPGELFEPGAIPSALSQPARRSSR